MAKSVEELEKSVEKKPFPWNGYLALRAKVRHLRQIDFCQPPVFHGFFISLRTSGGKFLALGTLSRNRGWGGTRGTPVTLTGVHREVTGRPSPYRDGGTRADQAKGGRRFHTLPRQCGEGLRAGRFDPPFATAGSTPQLEGCGSSPLHPIPLVCRSPVSQDGGRGCTPPRWCAGGQRAPRIGDTFASSRQIDGYWRAHARAVSLQHRSG